MVPAEIAQAVKRIQFVTGRQVADVMAGAYLSVFKGRGMEFDEVRPYVPGDEVRDIDLNVTARLGQPFVKRFVEERELTVMLVVDVSRSMLFGTRGQEKRELAAELCALLGFAAVRQNDRVGMALVSDSVEHFVSPARGRVHLLRILRDVLDHESARGTRLGAAARFLTRTLKRRSLVFWISDFEDRLEAADWRVMAARHELTALAVRDPADDQLPRAGWALLEDLETGKRRLVNTNSPVLRQRYATGARERRRLADMALSAALCPTVEIRTDRPYVPALVRHFQQRKRRGVA